MTNKEIENKIQSIVSDNTPDVLEAILQDCSKQRGEVFMIQEEKPRTPLFTRLALATLSIALLFVSFTNYRASRLSKMVASVVSLDVNPSLSIQINNEDKVLDVLANNEDGLEILEDMDFSGSDIKVAVNALIGSMVRHGYLSDIANSLLISVEDNDAAKAKKLEEELMIEIDKMLNLSAFDGALISQTISKDNEVDQLSEKYGITKGKVQLIQQIVENRKGRYQFEDLISLTINELNILNTEPLEKANQTGNPSTKAYIGEDKAKQIAFQHAGVKANEVNYVNIEMDYDDGVMEYEIEFATSNTEYEYGINAVNGSIMKAEKEVFNGGQTQTNTNTVTPAPTADSKNNQQNTNTQSNAQAATNANTNTNTNTNNQPASNTSSYIGEEKAKQIALNHAGVSNPAYIKVELDDGNHYDVDFKAGGYEYDYEVNAFNGNVIKHSKEYDDDQPSQSSSQSSSSQQSKPKNDTQKPAQSSTQNSTPAKQESTPKPAPTQAPKATPAPTPVPTQKPTTITADQAKNIALSHAGVSNVRDLSVERDDGGYDVEFKANGYEYDYEVSYTGSITKAQKERDD